MQQLSVIGAAGTAAERDAQYDVLAGMLSAATANAHSANAPPVDLSPPPLLETLASLRQDLHTPRAPLQRLAQQLHVVCDAFANLEQAAALAIAKESAMTTADTLPLLRRAIIEDPDDEHGVVELVGTLTSALSGYGEHTTTFSAGGLVRLQLRVRPQAAGTATCVWHAAHLAAWACVDRWAGVDVRGRRVLEIGCGTAAAGLTCAALGAAEVWLTDNEPAALDLARRNAALNGLAERTHTALFDLMTPAEPWVGAGDASSTGEQRASEGFDFIVASDVLYDLTAPHQLVETLTRLLRVRQGVDTASTHATPAPFALVAASRDPTRSQTAQRAVHDFVTMCASHQELQVVAEMSSDQKIPEGHGDMIMLLLARRTNQ